MKTSNYIGIRRGNAHDDKFDYISQLNSTNISL